MRYASLLHDGLMNEASGPRVPPASSWVVELSTCQVPLTIKPPAQTMLPFSTAAASAKRGLPIGFTVVHLSLTGSYLQEIGDACSGRCFWLCFTIRGVCHCTAHFC
jgi:hypothetical protein